MRNKIFTQSQVFPHNILTNCKGKKNSDCDSEENWQVIKVNITSNGANQHRASPVEHPEKDTTSLLGSPAKNS